MAAIRELRFRAGLTPNRSFIWSKKIIQSGRSFIGFDLDEIGVGETGWDANVGARILWRFCNYLASGTNKPASVKLEECVSSM